MIADLNFFQNVEKSVCAKAFGNDNRIKTPANQVCALITPIEANEFNFDAFTAPSITVFSVRQESWAFEKPRLIVHVTIATKVINDLIVPLRAPFSTSDA